MKRSNMHKLSNREKEAAYATVLEVGKQLEAELSAVAALKDIAVELQKVMKGDAALAETLKPLTGAVAKHAAKAVSNVFKFHYYYTSITSSLKTINEAEQAEASNKTINEIR